MTGDFASRHDRARRSRLMRSAAVALALLSWLGPVRISWQAARQSAATVAARSSNASESIADRLTSWRTTGSLLVRRDMQQAEAAVWSLIFGEMAIFTAQ